jgi:hypothetical protein
VLGIVYCLRHPRFGNWFYDRLQVIGCHYTDRFISFYFKISGVSGSINRDSPVCYSKLHRWMFDRNVLWCEFY